MTARSAAILAWSLFALTLVVLLGGVALIIFGSGSADDLFVLAVVGYALVGALVASRLPGNTVGWVLLAIGISLSLGTLADSYIRAPDPPALGLAAWLSDWSFFIGLWLAAIFLPLVFPDGRLVSRRWRPVLWLGVMALAFSILGAALKPGRLDVDAATPVDNPVGIRGAEDALSVVSTGGDALAALAFLLAAASLLVRFRRSRGVERQQLKWFAYVGLLATAALALAMLQVFAGSDSGEEGGGLVDVLGNVGWFTALATIVIGVPVATGFAILRHRLYDIDVVIRRTLVYGLLTAALAAVYLGSVLLLQLALRPLTSQSNPAIGASTLAVAALFRPARGRIQAVVDRRFYRRKYDAARTLEGFSARMREQVDLDALSDELRAVVLDTMQPAHVSLWLHAPGAGR